MRGTMLIFKPGASEAEARHFTRALDLGDLKDGIGGGWLEAIPGFTTIQHDGAVHNCAAFCDEEGKLMYRTSGLARSEPDSINYLATILWERALHRLDHALTAVPDVLTGQIAVIYGDDEFMSEL